jgi:UDP-glucose 4-epimerase
VVAGHQIPVFKKTAESFATLTGDSAGFDAVSLRIGTIGGPLGLPDSPPTRAATHARPREGRP